MDKKRFGWDCPYKDNRDFCTALLKPQICCPSICLFGLSDKIDEQQATRMCAWFEDLLNEAYEDDSYDYFSRCESCVYFKSYCYDEYDADVWCEIFDELRYEDCEKYEKRLEDKNNCVFNKDAKSPCKDYDECSKRQGTNKPLPCVVNWMMGRPFENMKKEANR